VSQWQAPEPPPGVRWHFSSRAGGVSSGPYAGLNLADHVGDDPDSVSRNREVLAGRIGLAPERIAVMQAAHGRDAAIVSEAGTVPAVDGLVTTTPGLGLLAQGADCATVALADSEAGVVAAVHSGWRGVSVNATAAVVERMVALGAEPSHMHAAIGPVICPGCYEVSSEVRDQVGAAASSAVAETRRGTPAVDLHAGVIEQLQRAGVQVMAADPACTYESSDRYSYRRDGTTGRQGMLIALIPVESTQGEANRD